MRLRIGDAGDRFFQARYEHSSATPLFGENEHVHPEEKPFDEPTFVEQTLGLGEWTLDTAGYFPAFQRGTVAADTLASADLDTGWRADNGYLYNSDHPDARLQYDFVRAPTGPVSLIAVPDGGRLTLTDELDTVPLLAPGDVDAPTIVAAATGQVRDIQKHWIFYTSAGLMLLIRPVALLFSGLNDFTYAPFGKRLAITAGVAAAITAVIGLLLPK